MDLTIFGLVTWLVVGVVVLFYKFVKSEFYDDGFAALYDAILWPIDFLLVLGNSLDERLRLF